MTWNGESGEREIVVGRCGGVPGLEAWWWGGVGTEAGNIGDGEVVAGPPNGGVPLVGGRKRW